MVETVIIRIAQGSLRGQKVKTQTGTAYYSFHAIPYAKPPVGPLRFKPPEPAQSWDGIRDALKEGPIPPQFNVLDQNKYDGEEDCLYINVFTPKLPDAHGNHLRPVMVYIHGGGFFGGSGNKEMHGPGRIMNTGEVVLVTMNYRVGALGFLCTGDSVVPGNNGLKDQVMALRWVQQNIAQFGGDPRNVTIGGISAGAVSVHLLYVSPMGNGLFHRAIASSGCALCPWAVEDSSLARKKAFRLGEALGCKTSNSRELLQFLMKVPARKLVEIIDQTLTEEEKHPKPPVFFVPVIESGKQKEDPFLPETPIDIIRAGKFNKVPLIIGVCSREGLLIAGDYLTNPSWYHSFTDNFEPVITVNLKTEKRTDRTRQISSRVKEFYFGDKPISEETVSNLTDLYGDMFYKIWAYRSAKEQQEKSRAPVYLYQFSFDGYFGQPPFIDIGVTGAPHGWEMVFLFETTMMKTHYLDPEDDNMKTCSRLLKMWTNFAKTGNPTPEDDPLLGVTWKPVTQTEVNYLNIDRQLSMEKDFMKENMDFWDSILTL